jgi:hypothetical protein
MQLNLYKHDIEKPVNYACPTESFRLRRDKKPYLIGNCFSYALIYLTLRLAGGRANELCVTALPLGKQGACAATDRAMRLRAAQAQLSELDLAQRQINCRRGQRRFAMKGNQAW